ncbi:MAG: phosphate ABC transporter ATP-binding protein [Methanomassiliicoccales archaeon]|nr:phosphate ABC transporter ATP-binding protein [Methanomassiliicoccales archaeon]
MNEILRTEGLTKEYGKKVAVSDVSISVNEGDVIGIMGPSGSGKSTFFRLINMLEPPTKGTVVLDGKEISTSDSDVHMTRRKMALVLQKPAAMNRSVFNNIAFGLQLRGIEDEEVERRVTDYLGRLGLAESKERNARSLSGGEMQRMCFARSVIVEPKLILLDEFTANLDPQNISILENAVRDFVKRGDAAAMIITHNPFQAKRLCDRSVLMMDGEFIEQGETSKIFSSPSDERTKAFVSGEMVF